MRKFLVLLAVLGLVAGACGGDSGGDSCESVADEAVELLQEVIDELDDLSLEEIGTLTEDPEALTKMEEQGAELEAKATELGCSDEQMNELLQARAGNLTADGPFGQLMVEGFQEEGFFE